MKAYERLNAWMRYEWMNSNHAGYNLGLGIGQTLLLFLGCHSLASVIKNDYSPYHSSSTGQLQWTSSHFTKRLVQWLLHQDYFLRLSHAPQCNLSSWPHSPGHLQTTVCTSSQIWGLSVQLDHVTVLLFLIST